MSDPISRIEREREIVEMITMPHNNNSNRSTAPNALLQPPPPPPPPQLPTMTNKDDISGDEGEHQLRIMIVFYHSGGSARLYSQGWS